MKKTGKIPPDAGHNFKKNTMRVISFYKYGQGNRYYEGNTVSDFNLI